MGLKHLCAFAAAFGTIAVGIACSSVPEVTFSDDASVDPDTSTVLDGPKPDTSSSGGDSAPDANCKVTGNEICEDGIDNDCDGKIDCEDADCQATHQCVDAIPTGWGLVAFNATSRAESCPTGYEAAVDVKDVTGVGAGGTCSCACNPTVGSCGTWGVTTSDTMGTCGGATVTQNAANTGTCTALTSPVVVPNDADTFGVAAAPTLPTTCGDTRTKMNVPPINSGRMCPAAQAAGKGCANNGACVRKPTKYPSVCVTQLGSSICPGVYTQRHTAGTDTTADNRDCNTCNCQTTSCGASIQLYDATDCTLGGNKKTSGALVAACSAFPDKNFTATHFKVNNATNGCAVAGVFSNGIVGNIVWDQERTICCKP